MLYRFISKDGNVVRIGDIDDATLEAKLQGYIDSGFALAQAEAWDSQVIKGATAGMIPDPSNPTSAPSTET